MVPCRSFLDRSGEKRCIFVPRTRPLLPKKWNGFLPSLTVIMIFSHNRDIPLSVWGLPISSL